MSKGVVRMFPHTGWRILVWNGKRVIGGPIVEREPATKTLLGPPRASEGE